ncbi:DUF998 domain-containing protein [Georgenia yuyongxinii]|uniref:DUF998 domain-containing protein n=1 Tax=Georgenia yuyongxinii TaxID=2589797 RepID=A0A5B8C4J5_9MICO|nr:DUF998 domain-containing protein [Georgenia yuyongxinii]QDC24235.1 DUF998 domain-containing protein [Georgenia yuyongxinii]
MGARAAARRLLAGGVVAGPLFLGSVGAQMLLRDGFDVRRHGLSLLSHGDLGWVQISTFVVTGLLVEGLAVGLHLAPDRWGGAGPAQAMGAAGVGLILAGMFRVDAYGDFPPGLVHDAGARPGGAERVLHSAHGVLHGTEGVLHDVGTALAINAALVACVLLARRFARSGRRGWAGYCSGTAVVGAVLAWWPWGATSVRLVLVSLVLMVWVALVSARLRGVVVDHAPQSELRPR